MVCSRPGGWWSRTLFLFVFSSIVLPGLMFLVLDKPTRRNCCWKGKRVYKIGEKDLITEGKREGQKEGSGGWITRPMRMGDVIPHYV